MKTKFFADSVVADSSLGERQIKVIANSGQQDLVGDVLVAAGCQLGNYNQRNPIVLDGHNRDKPVGTAKVYIVGERLEATITFAPLGASPDADRVCALAKAGVLSAVSVGFKPVRSEPIRGGGERFLSWILLELSVVSVPCDPGALVIARSMNGKSGRVLNARNSAAIAEIERCLGKSTEAHEAACELLEKSDKHRAKAMRHAAAIAASQSVGDEEDPNDDDSDQELGYGAARRKRLIEIASKASGGDRGAARRARAIEITRLAHSA
jgi:HK97 family phage prohead protease